MGSRPEYDEAKIPADFGCLFITNLVDDEDRTREVFREKAQVEIAEIRLLKQKEDQTTRAGIIDVGSKENAKKVMRTMAGRDLFEEGKKVRVNWDGRSMQKRGFNAEKESGGDGGGGGFGFSFGGFGGSAGNGAGSSSFQSGGPRNFDNTGSSFANGGASDVNVSFSHCGRVLVPLRDTKNTVVGYIWEEATGNSTLPRSSAANEQSAAAPAASSTGFGRGFGAKRDEPVAEKAAPVGGEEDGKSHEPARGFGRGFGAKRDEPATEKPAPASEEEGKPYFRRRDVNKSKSSINVIEDQDKDIMPEIQDVPQRTSRRRILDASVSVSDAQRGKDEKESDAPRRRHAPIEAPKEGEEPVKPVMAMGRMRARSARIGQDSTDLDAFPGTSLTVGEEVVLTLASVLPDCRVGFFLPQKDKALTGDDSVNKIGGLLKNFYDGKAESRGFEENKPVAVKDDKSNQWYRGKCLTKGSPNSLILLVDVGEELSLPNTTIQPLDKQFGDPCLAVVATLEDVPKNMKSTDLEKALTNYEDSHQSGFKVVVRQTDPLVVAMAEKNGLFGGEASGKKIAGNVQTGASIGNVLFVDSGTGQFFLVDDSNLAKLDEIQSLVKEDAEKNLRGALQVNEMNAVLFDDDNVFYRGILTSKTAKGFEVDFFDYGNMVEQSADKIRGLSSSVANMGTPTLGCFVANVPTKDQKNPALIAQLNALLSKSVPYEVKYEKDGLEYVFLWDAEGKLVGEEFMDKTVVQNGLPSFLAKDMTYYVDLKKGDKIPVAVSHVADPEFVFLNTTQFNIDTVLSKLQVRLQEEGDKLPKLAEMPPTGSVVVAKFSLDNQWYRAAIEKEGTAKKRLVTYVDYGNTEEVELEDMREITKELFEVPRAAFQVGLNGIAPVGKEYSRAVNDKAMELLASKLGQLTVTGVDKKYGVFEGDLVLDEGNQSAVDLLVANKCGAKK
ncbi:uncharacterized protein LOC129582081 [Paramacrobiotus metropolitanus]|uniref:uncharacterized protein LOC129582081 n=1 Tax=Paramacrobiotus metropolitanus TaxID=2943436 RepID=UPI0024459985|nr:uncharacterized protein LOC129582081 [Paramacrobiotus metropolitanus]